MADPTQFTYSHRDIAAMMVKEQGIHEGLWGPVFRFGLKATNLGSTEVDLQPSAVVGVVSIGLQKVDKPNNLTVDASQVNPSPRKTKVFKRIAKGAD